MVDAVLRARRRRSRERLAQAASRYAALGWPVAVGTYPPARAARSGESSRRCSCDRVGCPSPAAHPVSPAWQVQASVSPTVVSHWWTVMPEANVLLVTGRAFDVLDVPAAAGRRALSAMAAAGIEPGPVAVSAGDRALFFVTSRTAHAGDDELWSCHLDCQPESLPQVTGLRWHCTDSYVLAPPSRLADGALARWVRGLGSEPLPDPLLLLEYLADACEEMGAHDRD